MNLARRFLFALLVLSTASSHAENNANAVPTLPPPPTIEGDIELPKKSPMDRQKSTAQAKAMQLMQSQKSGMMCQMMRQMAQKEPDPTNKMMMMMMAQKSCDDSDSAKKAADENDKNAKLISQEDVPKMQKLKASALPLDFGKQTGSDETQNLDAFKVKLDENYTKTDGSIPTTDSTALVAALTADAGAGGSEVVTPKDLQDAAREGSGGGAAAGSSMSALPGLANGGKAGANGDPQSAPGNGPGGMSAFGGGGGSGAGAGGSAAGADGKAATGENATATADRKRDRGTDAGAGAGGGGGSEAPAKAGNDPFEALLAQMLGGPPASGDENGFNAGETVSMEQASKAAPTTNLFEYASLRYRRLATTQRVVAQSRSRKDAVKVESKGTDAKAEPKVAAKAPVDITALDQAKKPAATVADRKPASVGAAVAEPRRATLQ